MAMTKTIQATVKNRTDTAANWTQKNPVLAEGEIIVVQTSAGETRLKIGDGVKTFTQLPYTDEQIYNNVVTSVNGQTGDITMNSVEYTSQTLTDAQKKQARDNIDAAIADFVVNGTLNSDNTVTLDKTFAQIQAAIQEGKRPVLKAASDVGIFSMPLVAAGENAFVFAVTAPSGDYGNITFVMLLSSDVAVGGKSNFPTFNSDGLMPQMPMAAGPSSDMQIATKKYVDDHVSADVYVDFWPTGTEVEYNGNFNGYQIELATDQTFDAIFDSIKAGNKIVARLYKDADKSESPVSSVDTAVAGNKEFGAIHFQFVTVDTDAVAGFPFIGEDIMMLKMETSTVIFLVANLNALPTPNADGTDNGKVPIINGIQWELKKPPAGSPDAVLYTPQTLTDAQKKQARQNIDVESYFVINGTLNSDLKPTLDKTFSQIREAISDGKIPIVAISGSYFQLSQNTDELITFLWSAADKNSSGFQTIDVYPTKGPQIHFYRLLSTDIYGALPQVNMSSDPTEAMQIATKKYVDDKISDKELILSSSTAGSTKKFKLTIDDTGTLTASEITA